MVGEAGREAELGARVGRLPGEWGEARQRGVWPGLVKARD